MALQERQAWQVKDEAVYDDLVNLMEVTDEDIELLKALKPEAEKRTREMTDDFYTRLFAHEMTKEYFEGQDMERLHKMIGDWFLELFSGQYDRDYVKHRLKIGYVHVKIGLPVRYPLAMIDIINSHGESIAETSNNPAKAKEAVRKVTALDIAVFNQAYEDNQLNHLVELVGNERLARRLLQGMG
ncbi:MAG: protoglobin domain-containing protein [Halothece sp.]